VDLYIHSSMRLHDLVLNSLSTGTTLPYIYIYKYVRKTTRSGVSLVAIFMVCILLCGMISQMGPSTQQQYVYTDVNKAKSILMYHHSCMCKGVPPHVSTFKRSS
jgi:hypothetical protein